MTTYKSWQMIRFRLTSPRTFAVIINGSEVFRGKGVLAPTGDTYINIGDIITDYFSLPVPSYGSPLDPSIWVSPDLYQPCTLTADVVVQDVDTYEPLFEGVVVYDQSYGREPSVFGGSVPSGGVVVHTIVNDTAEVPIEVVGEGGTIATYTANTEENKDITISIPLSAFPTATAVLIGGARYEVVPCSPAALYYVDARGQMQCLPLTSVKERADIERKTYSKVCERYGERDFSAGVDNYGNTITRKYECGSGWLTEEQMAALYNLTESRCVWLWGGGVFIPVVLTNTTSESPTNKTNDYKPYRLTIGMEEARSERR